ncbi:MAG: YhcH/YjgK/YiaL family protein [Prolixibacteraceae bacterium]|nr:YhcH/YjgK/YiaL family protein [Prolixibacteraceae bacterium]
MILDKIENIEQYKGLAPLLDEGLKFISENDFKTIEPGKFFLKDTLLYASINEYETKPMSECKLEGHRKYIDIQYMVSGSELIGFTSLSNQQPSESYNEGKDVVFFREEAPLFPFTKGQFAVFFPDDLHQPGILNQKKEKVRKVVVKVAV